MSGNTAWVTLATNDTYCLGALVLANSLKRVNTVHQLAVLITPGVSQSMRQQLAKVFNVVKEVDVLDSGDEANLALIARPELGVTFTKLHCWNLTQFSKCVFLDADVLVVQNCDELFEREELSAAPDVGWPDCFNSGVFVFLPSKDTFKALIDCALGRGSFDGGDQGLLNTFFNDWPTKDIKKHLPFIYNMVSTASYSYLPAFKLFGSQVKIVHFIGSNKPWLQSGSAATSSLSGFLETWWNIFNSHVAQALSTDMVGLAGALAGGERSAIEDVWRRQNWEQGVIDYMGRDSFENIWKKISESVENKASVPGTAPSAPLTEAGEKSVTPPAVPAESKEVPSQQIAKEPTGSAVAPPVKAEQTEGAPVCAEPPTVDKTTSPTEKKEEAPKTEIEPAKECITSDTAESAKVTPPTSVESAKETAQDLLKTDAPATMAAPGLPSEITPPLVGEPPKTDLPTQLLPAVPELPSEAKTEIHADTKLLQEEKLKAAPSETKEPELKSSADTAGKEVTEAAVAKQEVPKTEASLPTPAEGAKPETTQPGIEVPKDTTSVAPKADIIDAKADEAKMSKPEATSSAAPKTEDVKTLPTEVKPTQEAPKDGSEATEKPSKDDSKQKKTPIDLKEVPGSTETLVKDDSALKAPTLPTSPTQKEASSELKKDDSAQKEPSTPEGSKGPSECSKMPVKDESAPIPLPPIVPTETVAASTETPVPAGTPTTPATPQTHTASGTPVTPTCSPATPTDTKATPTSTPGTPTVTPPTPTGTAPVSTEKSGKDDALPKVPSSPLAVKETTAEQPKKDDCPTKAPSSLTESKDVPKKDDTVPKVPIEPAAISKADVPASVAPSEVSPPAEVPSESTGQAKSSAESKKSPPQPPAAEGASAAAAAPVPPKRKGNKEQKSGNGGKQSKSKK
ncbi:glycogenin 1 isoform X4 [Rhodnius prolixus]|uniref:glycogenin 1 isoform X4 n=1 Tax=Rhodnius prolixus TaxID=13249 RepID=UPI003D18CD15